MGFKIGSFILLGVCALIMIIVILMQSHAEGSGTNALTGSSETYYSQNKGSTRDGWLKRITVICAVVIFLVTIGLTILLKVQA